MNWAAVIPARFIIAKDISSTQKLLLGLISSLSNLKGYCFASNDYLAQLLDSSKATISHSISDLESKGYIGRIIYRNDKQQVEQRILTIVLDKFTDIPLSENEYPLPLKKDIPPSENYKDNININNKINNNINNKEIVFFSSDWKDLWNVWIQYKKEEHRDKFKSKNTEQVALNHLMKISNNDKGLFELKIKPKSNDKLTQFQDFYANGLNFLKNSTSQTNPEVKQIGSPTDF
jgi:DNA-binding MarR family transcriptional regulator